MGISEHRRCATQKKGKKYTIRGCKVKKKITKNNIKQHPSNGTYRTQLKVHVSVPQKKEGCKINRGM
jgi:hypothetical protein